MPTLSVVSINRSAIAGPCDKFFIDVSDSLGSAGRQWSFFNFAFTSSVDRNPVASENDCFNKNYNISPPTPSSSEHLSS